MSKSLKKIQMLKTHYEYLQLRKKNLYKLIDDIIKEESDITNKLIELEQQEQQPQQEEEPEQPQQLEPQPRIYKDYDGNVMNTHISPHHGHLVDERNNIVNHIKDDIYHNYLLENSKWFDVSISNLNVGDIIKIYGGKFCFYKVMKITNKMISFSELLPSEKINKIFHNQFDYTEYYLFRRDGEISNVIKKAKKNMTYKRLEADIIIDTYHYSLD